MSILNRTMNLNGKMIVFNKLRRVIMQGALGVEWGNFIPQN